MCCYELCSAPCVQDKGFKILCQQCIACLDPHISACSDGKIQPTVTIVCSTSCERIVTEQQESRVKRERERERGGENN